MKRVPLITAIIFFQFFLKAQVFALVGSYLQEDSIPPKLRNNLCEIIQDNTLVCTGTRVSPDLVYSAAHCGNIQGQRKSRYGVRCGSNPTVFAADIEIHPRYRNTKDPYFRPAGIDIAKFHGLFSDPSMENIDLFDFSQHPIVFENCITGGYGYNNDEAIGELNFIKVNRVWFETKYEGMSQADHINLGITQKNKAKSSHLRPINVLRFEPFGVQGIDSGGPLFCEQDGVLKLVSVHSGHFLGAIPLTNDNIGFQLPRSKNLPLQEEGFQKTFRFKKTIPAGAPSHP